ncbi:MAG: hypothetical protein JWQ54_2769 [Mucilaginibacter sp.]|nr:hypothetical protein [Mucilaginibacter sp.]
MFCTYKHIIHNHISFIKNIFILMLIMSAPAHIAKSNPTTPISRLIAFKRAKSLDNGITISWYEQTWNKDILAKIPLKSSDFKLLNNLALKASGFLWLFRISNLSTFRVSNYLPTLIILVIK